MGWIVIKVNRDPGEDRWCLWSTIAEGPVFDGTEEEMTQRYLFENGERMRQGLKDRIERAKVHGGGTDYMGDWGDDLYMNNEGGILPRAKLADLLDIYARKGSREEVQALLEPFED
jgi:hypothetical protein